MMLGISCTAIRRTQATRGKTHLAHTHLLHRVRAGDREWMAVVAVLVAGERLLHRRARLAVAVVLVALGAWVALAPGDVPALVGLITPSPNSVAISAQLQPKQ